MLRKLRVAEVAEDRLYIVDPQLSDAGSGRRLAAREGAVDGAERARVDRQAHGEAPKLARRDGTAGVEQHRWSNGAG